MIIFKCENKCSAEYTMDGDDFDGYDSLEHWCSICGHTAVYTIGKNVIVIKEKDNEEIPN